MKYDKLGINWDLPERKVGKVFKLLQGRVFAEGTLQLGVMMGSSWKFCSLKPLHVLWKLLTYIYIYIHVYNKIVCIEVLFPSWAFPSSDLCFPHSDLWELKEHRIGMSGLDIYGYDYKQVYLSKE